MSSEQTPNTEVDTSSPYYCSAVKGTCSSLESIAENDEHRVNLRANCKVEIARIGIRNALFIHSHANACVATSFAITSSQLEDWTGPIENNEQGRADHS